MSKQRSTCCWCGRGLNTACICCWVPCCDQCIGAARGVRMTISRKPAARRGCGRMMGQTDGVDARSCHSIVTPAAYTVLRIHVPPSCQRTVRHVAVLGNMSNDFLSFRHVETNWTCSISFDVSNERGWGCWKSSLFMRQKFWWALQSLRGPSAVPTDKLQRVLNAAARVVSGTHKFDRGLSRLLHTELHCVPKKVTPNSNHYNYGTPYQN